MYTNIPHICEGEIIGVQKSPDAVKKNVVRYVVRVTLPNGSESILPNVTASTLFGGIDDYFQERARTTTDDGNKFDPSGIDENNNARIGQRVYISFISGAITKPVIIGYAQHPNQTLEFDSPEDLSPQAVLKYLGMRFDFMDTGALRITHFGAPKIKYVEASGLGGALAAVGAVGGLLDAAGDNPIDPDKANPAVEAAEASKRSYVEFSDTGGLEVRDSLNQLISVSTDKRRIYIANNDVQDGPQIATNNTDSEYVLLDRDKELVLINARKTAQIYSFGKRKDVTEGDHTHHVLTDEMITVDGDKEDKIGGDLIETIGGDYRQDVSGAYTVSSTDSMSFDIQATFNINSLDDIEIASKAKATFMSAGAVLLLDTAKIKLGVGGTEVLKTLSDTIQSLIDTLTAILKLTVPTSMGPSGPPINAAEFTNVITKLTTLKTALDIITA